MRKKLEAMAEEKYRQFAVSLLPAGTKMLGVRLPKLRELAKQMAKQGKSDWGAPCGALMEEKMLEGMIIGYADLSFEERCERLRRFVPKIDNWSVCDCFCCSLKYAKTHKDTVWNIVNKYAHSEKEYEIRFAHVMMLNYFIEKKYLNDIFSLAEIFKCDKYYARMGAAWLLSICFIKYPEETLKFLKNTKIDNFTYNKSIQKICESYRVDKATKQKLKLTKRQF